MLKLKLVPNLFLSFLARVVIKGDVRSHSYYFEVFS